MSAETQRFRMLDAPAAPAATLDVGSGSRALVRWLKIGLPLAALVLVGLVLAWPDPTRKGAGLQLVFSPGDGKAGQPGLIGGRFVGLDRKGQPFVVTANTALQRIGLQVYDLVDIQADIGRKDGGWIGIKALRGVLDRERQTLALDGGIEIYSDSGYEFATHAALIELKQGRVVSTVPVQGQGPAGTIVADGLVVLERGRVMEFAGPVRARIFPRAQG
ncbi:MAG: hypothetical protein FJX46_14520 [Alphaproteobacteria bacterium]|nr:hypothetical protein [Alphaproteobacteria bacterium]